MISLKTGSALSRERKGCMPSPYLMHLWINIQIIDVLVENIIVNLLLNEDIITSSTENPSDQQLSIG